ncbi:ABC transporter permease [Paenibacillus sp. UMB4589-SE434]|uniref:ABC transporter permease n=1 Tax=Paenibacillus sp. UMB4589-SE434 TaxID=3046314 RepID=UPI0025515515|nr:ABC transporter permease [Paenibacillus sp. UMB4589-SE434]MDK8181352.1 ABC transporter permease [Paenibacillus sp. UMB4589-SE434]
MIRSIFIKETQLLLKDKGTFFWLFVLPILFIVMFSSIFGNAGTTTYTIRYYDADGTKESNQFIETLARIKGFELAADKEKSLADQIQAVRDGKQTSVLVIPQGYSQRLLGSGTAEVELHRDAAGDAATAPVAAVLDSVTKQYQEHKLRVALKETGQSQTGIDSLLAAPIQVKDIKENVAKANPVTQIVPGYTVMFVFFIMITMIHNFLRDRDSGMVSRLKGTPLKPHQYLIGMWLPNMMVVLIQSTVLLTFGFIVYGLHLGDLLAVAAVVISLSICATGIGLMLSMLVNSVNTGVAIVQIIAMGGAIVGGLWFPYDFLPKAVQWIGLFTPQYWAQRGMQDVMIRGVHLDGVWITILILLAFGLAGLAVATASFNRFAAKAKN